MGTHEEILAQPLPLWAPGECGHDHPEDVGLAAWPEEQRDWPLIWRVVCDAICRSWSIVRSE
jgi:hypothetical protein